MMMFRGSSPAAAAAEDSSTRTWSISSRGSTVSSSSSSGLSNDHHELHDVSMEGEEVVGVAVGKEVKECKANLMWVLSNMDAILGNHDKQRKKGRVLLLHVHRPAKTIPFMGANFPADQLHDPEVAAFRQGETEAMNRSMAKYRVICARVKVPAICKVAVEDKDDVAMGILSLVAENGITRLVMGAAADKRYSRKLMAPTSKTALSLQQQAPPTCSIWFLCKGNLVCTRLVINRASIIRKSDEERKAAAGHQVQLGTFIQSLHLHDEPSSSPIPHHQQQQLPRVPSSSSASAASAGSEYKEMVHIRYEQKQDIQTIFAEAEKLRREKQQHDAKVSQQQAQVQADEAQLINDLQAKLSEAHCMLFSLERDQEDLRRQRDAAVRETAMLRGRVQHLEEQLLLATSRGFTELSYQDLQEATNSLDHTLKLGNQQGGGYGSVYKAILVQDQHHHEKEKPVVAIKVLNPHGIITLRFQHKVEELRKLRHPNLVPLLGACPAPEAPALVYEFLPDAGSLEDRLLLLPWPERTRIATQICSALIFLHQNNMVHGDLKPTNVLLLDDGTAKLADYGLCRLLEPDDASAVMLRCNATSLPYMDPEFLATGELRPSSDVYAFGILLLRLLTGRPAMGLVKQVQAALAEGRLSQIIDVYPQEQAQQLARLGLNCCEMASTNRPDLAGEMVAQTLGCYLQPMMIR
ncbi:hypothetical protein PR202_gb28555 [Eleusine coracana subsp. coracana]|uniref:RING-type E3 ubiquitin transferase n=1 Tax=Eleusine coracana subsp. coracana TaxID=191504 RepID=A0AAV5FY29_ELECO|nr:hypothetical protein QOZ80_6AG0551760 [Eleusine coracana subsp. coracana]GJN39435.1 hypothetical protein PR202_gb28555 [Eleusine coracana subsp. coracana]